MALNLAFVILKDFFKYLTKRKLKGGILMRTKDFWGTKGITLISLIVSIVVLLILAGISIVTLTGENRNYR